MIVSGLLYASVFTPPRVATITTYQVELYVWIGIAHFEYGFTKFHDVLIVVEPPHIYHIVVLLSRCRLYMFQPEGINAIGLNHESFLYLFKDGSHQRMTAELLFQGFRDENNLPGILQHQSACEPGVRSIA